jgi:iron complex outermembrane receptor protein
MSTSISYRGAMLVCAAACNAAFASAPEATSAEQSVELAPVIVTAQRRSENLQNVPIAVTAVSGKALEDSGYQSVTDLQYLVPGLQYDPTQGAAFQIRGVGSQSFDFSNAKSVSVVVDDVVMDAQRANGLIGLIDIQRVDVLMGPQGTLFGKNATSGVMSVTTEKPELGRWSVNGGVSYGQRGDHLYSATVNAPLGESGALRVSAFDQGQDGYGTYTTLKRELGEIKEHGYRARMLFNPTRELEVILANDHQMHWDSNIRTAVSGAPAAVTAGQLANGVTPGPRNADNADTSFGQTATEEWGTSLRLRYKLGDATLTSITAYRGSTYDSDTPANLVPHNIYAYVPYNRGELDTSKRSQEFRLASGSDQFIEYVGGLFYNKLEAEQTQLQWATLGAPEISPSGVPLTQLYALTGAIGKNGNVSLFDAQNTTTAAFGQLKFNLTPQASVALGGRYTRDRNGQSLSYIDVPSEPVTGIKNTFVPTSAPPLYPEGSVNGHNFSYRVSPQYKLSKDVMVYANYTTGYKPGGVAFVGNKYDPYREETVKSFELGIKSELLGRTLRLNADVFVEKFKDFQTTILTYIPGNPTMQAVIGNAGGLRSAGAELGATWRAAPALTLNGSLSYTDGKYTDYVYDAKTNYTGSRLSNSPRWAGNLGVDYRTGVGANMMLKAHMDLSFRSELWTVVGQPDYSRVPGYALANARVTLSPNDSDLEYGVYARNLFNRYYSTGYQQYGPLGLLHYTTPNAYRTVGVFAKYNF